MILSHETLAALMKRRKVVVHPLSDDQIQPASIDLTLGDHFLKVDENRMDSITMNNKTFYEEMRVPQIVIPPLSFMLGTTRETIILPDDVTAFIEGRSSVGCLGLFIQNAGWVDPGFKGNITLELFNANRLPIRLHAGRRICQIVFAKLDRATAMPYCGKYQHQSGTVGSMAWEDTDWFDA